MAWRGEARAEVKVGGGEAIDGAEAQGRSLDVDAEARHLREVRGAGEVEDVHVFVHLKTVEPPEDEDTAVGEACGVVPACGRWPAGDRARFVL